MSLPLLLGLALATAALCYVLAPLVWPRAFGVEAAAPADPGGAAADPLARLRDDLFAQIVELDFDHATGKMDEEEYRHDRAALKRRALAVLRTIDERDAAPSAADEAIEEAVRSARARRAAPAEPDTGDAALLELDDEVERQVSALRRMRQLPATPRD